MNQQITADQIETLEGIDLIFEIFASIAIRQDKRYKSKREFVESLSKEHKYVYVTWILDMNVKNGGFQQYFYNSSGEFIDITTLAAKAMKMDKMVRIIDLANKIFLTNNSEGEEINFTDEEIEELSKLDKDYYHADTDEYVYNAMAGYIKMNKEKFLSKR